MHIHRTEDADGDLVEVTYFCTDSCHRAWCTKYGVEYEGWDGAHEGPDYDVDCAGCGEAL